MATPSDSVAPNAPTPSSLFAGIKTLVEWLSEAPTWIKGLSPAGATKYDTGWVDITLTDTSLIKEYITTTKPQVRRIGKAVFLDGVLTAVPAGLLAGTTETQFGQLPSGFAPRRTFYAVCHGSGSDVWLLTVTTGGSLTASRHSGTQPAGAWLPAQTTWSVY